MEAVHPEDLGPGGDGRERGSAEGGLGNRPRSVGNIFLCHRGKPSQESCCVQLCVCSCVHACVESPSAGYA